MNVSDAERLEAEIDAALDSSDLQRAMSLVEEYLAKTATEAVTVFPSPSTRFRALYLAAQVQLDAGRLSQALDFVRPLLAHAHSVAPALSRRLWLLSAEAHARQNRLTDARSELTRAQDAGFSSTRDPILLLREVRLQLWLGDVESIGDQISLCAQQLLSAGHAAKLAVLFGCEGRAWFATGNLERAEQSWRQAERVARETTSGLYRADVLVQLGRLEHLRGHLQGALDCYDEALRLAEAQTLQSLEAGLRRLLVLADLNQQDEAGRILAGLLGNRDINSLPEELRGLAVTVSCLVGAAAREVENQELRGFAAARQNDLHLARDLYRGALLETAEPIRQTRLSLALGVLSLAVGDRVEAQFRLATAEKLARELSLPEVLWRALHARGQVAAEIDGDEAAALRFWNEAIQISEQQAAELRSAVDAAAYRERRSTTSHWLLRAACRRRDAARMFDCQELDRGRLLLDLFLGMPNLQLPSRIGVTDGLLKTEEQINKCENELRNPPAGSGFGEIRRRWGELHDERDRILEALIRSRDRPATSVLPRLPVLDELQEVLRPGTVYLSPTLLEDSLFVLMVRQGAAPQVIEAHGATEIRSQVEAFRNCVSVQLERYKLGLLRPEERAVLDKRLQQIGDGPLGSALAEALATCESNDQRLIWVPDDVLHGFPIHAVRIRDRYLIEDHEITFGFSGALSVHQSVSKRRRGGVALVISESSERLPTAEAEGRGVASTFVRRRVLSGSTGTRDAVRRHLPRARVVHFACHAQFDADQPLAASIQLPSGEQWYAPEWLNEPVDGLPLVVLSACRSAQVGSIRGREAFGMVTALLSSGVRAVLAGLWPIADREASSLMRRFYCARMTTDVATALAQAQREVLARPEGSPLFWAAFALFGDGQALPAPSGPMKWLARWRQKAISRRMHTDEVGIAGA